jgi:NADPH:quinone reductase-like Zn-dependent oxidoreductase
MKAVVQVGYGAPAGVLRPDEVEKPQVADDGVLVRVRASSVNAQDWRRVRGEPFLLRLSEGLLKPRSGLFGGDAAGIVEEVGKERTDLAPGDEVYGLRSGAFAEYVSGRSFVAKPANLSFEQAAAVPAAGCTALQAVRDRGGVKAGQRVLVNGAGGGVGTFAVQIAKAFGAEVTATTRTECLDVVRSIGTDQTIDYTRESFASASPHYDVIIDCGGSPSVRTFQRVLADGGTLVLVAAGRGRLGVTGRLIGSQVRARLLGQPVVNFLASGPFNENLLTLKQLIEAGKVRPVIDRTYPLDELIEAIEYVETERACGKVVIRI